MKAKTANQTPAPKVDPEEEAAYKAFFDAVRIGSRQANSARQDFVPKYPISRYAESVYSGVVQAYYAKQDWKDFSRRGQGHRLQSGRRRPFSPSSAG